MSTPYSQKQNQLFLIASRETKSQPECVEVSVCHLLEERR